MITIPMKVSVNGIVVPMSVGSDSQTIGMSVGAEYSVASAKTYDGDYEVTPMAHDDQTLDTANKLLEENVTVFKVPYYQTSNEHGDTVYIASGVI